MGSHTFTWPHHADEVFVTGTFDNWQKTVKLDKHGNVFYKTVDLPAEKILYKFVVDGNWTTDHMATQEQDDQGITNNVLTPDQLKSAPSSHSFLSSAAPMSTTSALAGQVPLEKNQRELDHVTSGTLSDSPAPGLAESEEDHLQRNLREVQHETPGAFPETPANETTQFSVNPLPATSSAPVPGGAGASNPITLAPGEAVPESSTYTPNQLDTFAVADPTSATADNETALDKAHGTEGTEITHPAEEAEKAFGVAPLPATAGIGNPIKLAPGEPVPDPSTFTTNTIHSTVGDMRSESGAPQIPPILSPQSEDEANGADMFNLPPITGGPGPFIPESSLPMGLAMGAGAAAAGLEGRAGAAADPEHTAATGAFGEAALSSVAPQSTSAQLAGQVPIRERGVPEVVTESEKAAHESPEAAAYTEPVEQKSAMEDELKSKIPEAQGETAFGHGNAIDVPASVTESQIRADADPEAAASETAVADKGAMEAELKQKVPEEPATSSSGVFGSSERGITGAIAGGAIAVGGAVAAAAYAAKDKAQEQVDQISDKSAATTTATSEPVLESQSEVPATVIESQKAAHVSPEASADSEAVLEKADMEAELKSKVPEEPATSSSGVFGNSEAGVTGKVAAGAAVAGAAVASGIYAARDKTSEVTGIEKDTILPPSVAGTIDSLNNNKGTTAPTSGALDSLNNNKGTTAPTSGALDSLNNSKGTTAPIAGTLDSLNNNKGTTAPTSAVPEEVKESQKAAHVAPEASSNPEAVAEKSEVERELLREVKLHNETGEPAPTAAAAAFSATAPAPTTAATETSLSPPGEPTLGAAPEGLNAGANSQAQSLATKTGALANSEKVDTEPVASIAPSSKVLTESANTHPASAREIAERVLGSDVADLGLGGPSSGLANESTEAASRDVYTAPVAVSSTTAPAPVAEAAPAFETARSAEPVEPVEPSSSVAAEKQAEAVPVKEKSLFDPKTKSDNLTAPENANVGDSRDVSPMSKVPTDGTTGAASSSALESASKTPASPPQKEKINKRDSVKTTSDSQSSVPSSSSPATEAKPKKKGFLAKLKEKLKG